MDGRANVVAWAFPRPSSPLLEKGVKPFSVEVPPNFSIHFSHAYEDKENNKIVAMFSGWPPNDSKDFLGAWGGFAPVFDIIPPTFLWRLELPLDNRNVDENKGSKKAATLSVARGSFNVCTEHPLVHPNFQTKKVENVYSSISNVIGDSSPPTGYARFCVEEGSKGNLSIGEENRDIDMFWFGTRAFAGEPLIVPKLNSDPNNERQAFLLGMVYDAVRDKSSLAVFDLEKDLASGPVCRLWFKSAIPHGLHGCFAENGNSGTSWFC